MAREVRVAILGDARDFGRAVRSANDDAGRLDGTFGRIGAGAVAMGNIAANAIESAVRGGIQLVGGFIRSAEESAQVTGQTAAVIASMGNVAGVTAEQVADLSTALSLQSGIDDELIQSGANVMLTFGQVQNRVGEGNDIFDRATQAALDMSVALGTDMSAASMQVGKALNDPIRGLTQLRRSGIQFTEQQEAQIRAMVEAGDVAGAQRVMLEELERQFGGSAEAQATASGRLSVAWGNLQEQIGGALLPVFETVATWLADRLPGAMAEAQRFMDESLRPAFERVVAWVRENWPEIQATVEEVMASVQEIISGVVDAVTAIWDNFGSQIMAVVSAAWTFVQDTIAAAVQMIKGIVDVFAGVFTGDWSRVWDGITAIVDGATDAILARIRFVVDVAKAILSAGWEVIRSGVVSAWEGIKGFLVGAWDSIVATVTGMPARIASAAAGMWDGIKNAFRAAINWIIRAWNGLEFRIPGFDPPGPGPSFGGFTLGVPDITPLARGGIVTSPTLAMIGEAGPEAVIPLGRGGVSPVVVRFDPAGLRGVEAAVWEALRKMVRVEGGGNVQTALGQ